MRNTCASIQSSYDFPRKPGNRELLKAEGTSNSHHDTRDYVQLYTFERKENTYKYERVNGSLYFCKNRSKMYTGQKQNFLFSQTDFVH